MLQSLKIMANSTHLSDEDKVVMRIIHNALAHKIEVSNWSLSNPHLEGYEQAVKRCLGLALTGRQ